MQGSQPVDEIHGTTFKAGITCYHCGQPCEETLWLSEKPFCCHGCKTVFEILEANDLCLYYSLDKNPGVPLKKNEETYAYLDEKDIRKKVIEFDSPDFARVRFYVPSIHCVSCVWLLENMQKLEAGILKSEVNFARRFVTIDFHPQRIKLSTLAQLLNQVGYAPQINLEEEKQNAPGNTPLVSKLAVAGFCFGNVMLLSFPEYLGLDHADKELNRIFSWLNLALSVPVFFVSAADYFKSASKSFKQKQINIDVPIALGLVALFLRSGFDIVTGNGPGYLDSFTGLVFFLLIGRWFQSKTYESLAFDRDFKSYFPLAVNKLVDGAWKPVLISDLRKEDTIRIRNMEIIPADGVLQDETSYIDYSFVTGESKPVKVMAHETIYAGGRLIGQPVLITVKKETSQSHLTSLWNKDAFRKMRESKYQKLIDRAARRFTWVVVAIASITAAYWYAIDPSQMWLIITSVLMVACPCALALAAPFTYGSMQRVFGKHNFYLKNADVIERLAAVDAIVFDKTGTVTTGQTPAIKFAGVLRERESGWVKLLTSYSTHPLSNLVTKSIHESTTSLIYNFKELPGKGIEGMTEKHIIRIGSASFTGATQPTDTSASYVFVSIDGNVRGHYMIGATVRNNIKRMLNRLEKKCVALLSGDNEADKEKMATLFGPSVQLLFNQSPHDKLEYIRNLQQHDKNVLMIGDGLNDSGALKQSDVGVAVTDDTSVFTPGCDAILQGDKVGALHKFLSLARSSAAILKIGFGISFLYNAIALGFAVTGHLTPLTAAILMPLSSITVVGFTSLAVRFVGKINFTTTL